MWGKQKPLGLAAVAKKAQAKADALAANSKSLGLLASAAKEEAQQARARAQEAEQKAAVYKDAAQKAHKFADGLYGRCRAALGHKTFQFVGPPMIDPLIGFE